VLARLDRTFVSRIWNDKKITAHHGIIPTRNAFQFSALTETERNVYMLIRRNYLAQFLPLHESDLHGCSSTLAGNCSAQQEERR
jgi:DNA topoisomerase-3